MAEKKKRGGTPCWRCGKRLSSRHTQMVCMENWLAARLQHVHMQFRERGYAPPSGYHDTLSRSGVRVRKAPWLEYIFAASEDTLRKDLKGRAHWIVGQYDPARVAAIALTWTRWYPAWAVTITRKLAGERVSATYRVLFMRWLAEEQARQDECMTALKLGGLPAVREIYLAASQGNFATQQKEKRGDEWRK